MRITFLLLLWVSISFSAIAQAKKLEYSKFFNSFYYRGPFSITFGGGITAYRGNLCGRPECNTFKPVYSMGINYRVWPHIAFGTELNYFHLQARSWGIVPITAFSSSDFDVRNYIRYYLLDDIISSRGHHRSEQRFLRPYLQLAIAGIYYNTYYYLLRNKNDPEILSISKKHVALAVGFPLTGGLCLALTPNLNLLGELTYMFTYSDYLDNVSSKKETVLGLKDSYVMANIKLQMALKRKK